MCLCPNWSHEDSPANPKTISITSRHLRGSLAIQGSKFGCSALRQIHPGGLISPKSVQTPMVLMTLRLAKNPSSNSTRICLSILAETQAYFGFERKWSLPWLLPDPLRSTSPSVLDIPSLYWCFLSDQTRDPSTTTDPPSSESRTLRAAEADFRLPPERESSCNHFA